MSLEPIGSDRLGRNFYVLELRELSAWPTRLEFVSRSFVLFLACEATQIDTETLGKFADRTIDQGLAYVCAWGGDCERVHDIFDETEVMRCIGKSDADCPGVLMTTWHAQDTLKEALWFFHTLAMPDEDYAPKCRDWIAASVGSPEQAEAIRSQLSDWLGRDDQ